MHMVFHFCLMGREGKLEHREKDAQSMQAEALALKTDLQSLAKALQGQADKQVTDAAEGKQALARHQARLDTLQVCCSCKHPPAACHNSSIAAFISLMSESPEDDVEDIYSSLR